MSRSLIRRGLRIAGWTLLGLVGLVIIALIALRAHFDDERITAMVPKIMEDAVRGKFRIGAIRLHLPTTAEIENLVVIDPYGDEVISAKYVKASIRPLGLLNSKIDLVDVTLRGATVDLHPPPHTKGATISAFTLIDAFQPHKASTSTAASPWKVAINEINLSEAELQMVMPSLGLRAKNIEMTRGRMEYSAEAASTGGNIRISEVLFLRPQPGRDDRLETGPIAVDVEELDYVRDVARDRSMFGVKNAVLRAFGSQLTIAGSMSGIAPEMDAGFDATLNLDLDLENSKLRELIPDELLADLDPRGRAQLTAEAKGTMIDGRVKLSLSGPGLQIAGVDLTRFDLGAQAKKGTIELEQLLVQLAEGRLLASGTISNQDSLPAAKCLLAEPNICRLQHRVELQLVDLPVRKTLARFVRPDQLPEKVDGRVELEGTTLAPLDTAAEFALAVQNIPASFTRGLVKNARVEGAAHVFPDRAYFERLVITGGGVRLAGQGTVPFDPDAPVSLAVRVQAASANPILRALKLPVSADSLEIEASTKGTISDPRAAGTLVVRGLRAPNAPRAEVRIPLRYDDGALRVENGLVELAGGTVRIDGSARLLDRRQKALEQPELDITVAAKNISLAPFTKEAVEGRASAEARFAGTPERWKADALVTLDRLTVEGSTLAVSPIRVTADKDLIEVAEIRVEAEPGARIYLAGRLQPREPAQLQARAHGSKIPAELLQPFLGPETALAGELSFAANASGALTSPALTATVAAEGAAYNEYELGDLQGAVRGNLDRLVGKFFVEAPSGRVDLHAVFVPEEKSVVLRVASPALALERLPGLYDPEGSPVGGTVAIDLTATGVLPFPEVRGQIRASGVQLAGQPLQNGNLEIKIATEKDSSYRIDAAGLGGIRAVGHVRPIRDKKAGLPIAAEAEIHLDKLSLGKIMPDLEKRGLDVVTTGRANLELVERAGKSTVIGSLELSQLHASFGGEILDARGPVRVDYDGRVLRLQELHLAGTSGTFRASGTLGERPDFEAHGRLNLRFIEPLVPQIARASGRADLDLSLHGKSFNGQIALISPVRVRPRGMVREVSLESGRIVLDDRQVRLLDLRGSVGGGTFSASGELGLDGFKPQRYALRFEGANLPFRNKDLLVQANARITVAGVGLAPKIAGEIGITRGRFVKELKLEQFTFLAPREDAEDEEEEEPPPWMSDVELDLHATSAGTVNIKVDADALDIDAGVQIDVFVRGTAADPRLDGRVIVQEGSIDFPRAELRMTEGSVDFVPTVVEGIRPVLDITAEGDLPGRPDQGFPPRVTLTLRGPLESIEMDLSSDLPGVERASLMTMLITGRTVQDLLEGKTDDTGQSTIDPGVAFVGSPLAGLVTNRFESLLDDALNLQLRLQTELSTERLRVTASREFSSRLRVEGGWERLMSSPVSATSASVLVFLSSSLFVEGTARSVTQGDESAIAELHTRPSGLQLKLRVIGE